MIVAGIQQVNMISPYISAATLLVATLLFHTLLRRLRARSIKHLPGPPPGPWPVGMTRRCFSLVQNLSLLLSGNMPAILRPKESGDADFAWTKEYGTAVCIKGTFGVSPSCNHAVNVTLNYVIITEGHVVYFRPQGRTFTLPSHHTLTTHCRHCNTFSTPLHTIS
jgi:hypothetical protein